ncbi:MAG: phosphoserine phosphatase SerB [Acidimicrobiales bacterium]
MPDSLSDPSTSDTPGRSETLLITVSGPDHPGVTSSLMGLLTRSDATIGDVEQVVVRGHLVLGVVATIPLVGDDAADALRKDLLLFGYEQDLHVAFDEVDPTPTDRRPGLVVTLIAPNVSADDFSAVARAIAGSGGNIDRIVRIARYPVMAYELAVHRADVDVLRPQLVELARRHRLDIALQPEGLGRRAQRLVVLDVDSTLIQDEVIALLADEAGCGDQVRAITERAMAGELDFEQALRERVRLLTGLTAADLSRARDRVRLTPGARTFVRTLQRLGFKIAIVSGGFTYFTDHLQAELGLDHAFANELEVVAGRLTGEVVGPVVDRARKAELLRQVAALEGISEDQTVAVGDGANDLDMLAAAGLGIAFNAKPVVRDAAHTSLSVPYLDAILFVLGVRRSEVEAADEADGTVTEYPAV